MQPWKGVRELETSVSSGDSTMTWCWMCAGACVTLGVEFG